MEDSVKLQIKNIVGDKNYFDQYEDRLCYSYDGTPIFQQLPEAVVFPQDEEQIASLFRLANQVPFNIVPRGAGTGLSGGSIPVENSIVIVLTKWNRILEIDTHNLTAQLNREWLQVYFRGKLKSLDCFIRLIPVV
jgi:glycolate oxidase